MLILTSIRRSELAMEYAAISSLDIGGTGRTLLRCWTETAPGAVVLHAEGEVDVTTAAALREAIAAAVRTGPPVIVDLGGLRYLDGSGIRVLEKAARLHPARFVVVGSKPEIHRLFDILGLTGALPVVRSLEAAREYLRLR
jgi:anti-sigma B factor antagonist